jgi:PKHD-type hydroxylase
VVVAWIQSHVRDAGAREALSDLAMALEAMHERPDQGLAYDLVNKTHINLLRRWAEP